MTFIFIFLAAWAWAKMEIQIEGKDGWAAALPTWRIESHWILNWFYGGRPLTGYHVWAFCFVFLSLHQPFFWGVPWSWKSELGIMGTYYLFWIVEDFLWFVLNPHYGWSRFNKREVWWHKRWLMGFPLDYWVLGSATVFLLIWTKG